MAKWMDTLEVIKGAAYEVETQDCGTCIVPEEVCGRAPGLSKKRKGALLLPGSDETVWDSRPSMADPDFQRVWEHLQQYVEGKRAYQITRKHGYCWRMTQPGYLDCTEWHFADSEEEVKEQAEEIYDHQEEE